jgi:hypothetical protein
MFWSSGWVLVIDEGALGGTSVFFFGICVDLSFGHQTVLVSGSGSSKVVNSFTHGLTLLGDFSRIL